VAIDAVGAILKQQKRPHVKIAVNPYSVGKVGINIDNNSMHVKSPLVRDPLKTATTYLKYQNEFSEFPIKRSLGKTHLM